MTELIARRFRIVPSRGRGCRSWHVYDSAEALQQAQEYADEHEISVAVCDAPEGGIVRQLYVVRPPEKKPNPVRRGRG